VGTYPEQPPPGAERSLGAILQARAERTPHGLACRFLAEPGDETITYAALHARASAIAALIRERGGVGAPVLVLYPSGVELVAAMFGCMYAGAIPVPPSASPRDDARAVTWQRLGHIARSAGAALVLTDQAVDPGRLADVGDARRKLQWLATGASSAEAPSVTATLDVNLEEPALIQYSSGSTSEPKGVVLTHRQLLANLAMWTDAHRLGEDDVVVNWLPHYHDLGLIGHLLLAIYVGAPYVGLDPLAFVERPVRWLRAISDYRGTFSGAPSFAYELCARRITEEQKRDLDLRSWRTAVNAAEPVRAMAIRLFAAAFEGCGFRVERMCPAYGLAEAAALVTGGEGSLPSALRCFVPGELSRGRAVEMEAGSEGRSLVGCGRPVRGTDVLIVEPDQLVACPPDTVGEIWVSSASVGSGYWRQPAETAAAFGWRPRGAEGSGEPSYLRTGDLGFLHEGLLYVTGRRKDTLIVHGTVHYPQDVEQSAEASHVALRRGCVAAFQVDDGEQERLVVLQEVEPSRFSEETGPECVAAIRRSIAEEHGLFVHTVCLLPRGVLAKTSSGKLRRKSYRAAFLEGSLPILVRSDTAREALLPEPLLSREALLVLPPDERRRSLAEHLLRRLARSLKLTPDQARQLRADCSLVSQGMDSLLATDLVQYVERELGVSLKLGALLVGATPSQVASEIAARLPAVEPSEEDEIVL
jgi:acyl-CoA synthetase (AMP-forming)/AMP-acid ligase II